MDMGGYIKRDVERVETAALNTKVNKEVFDAFKDCCKKQGYPLNVMLETFMRQYTSGSFKLNAEDILKFKNDGKEVDTLNTTFNKEIYLNFKSTCKANGFFLKHVIVAFMEKYTERNLVLEYIDMTEEE
jgi:disulfide oxidoreductase YuzD